MQAKVINRQIFQDGKIVLYQLSDRPRKRWLCRIKVPGGRGYAYRGTGTSDFYEARKIADELHDDLRMRVKLGQAVTGPSLKSLIADYETHITASGVSAKRQDSILALFRLYAVPYFTKKRVAALTQPEIASFFNWRRQNGRRKSPKNTTILYEMSQFKVFLEWCRRRGHLNTHIEMDRPKQDGQRRPHFDERDWKILTDIIPEWVDQGAHRSGPIYRDRVMLANYMLILANTGIRVGEARNLRWRNVDAYRFAAWCAATAASTSSKCRFPVTAGVELINRSGLKDMGASWETLPSPQDFDDRHRGLRERLVTLAGLLPCNGTDVKVRVPAILGFEGSFEWHGRTTRLSRRSGCCGRPRC